MTEYEQKRKQIENMIKDDMLQIEVRKASIDTAKAILAGEPDVAVALALQQVALLESAMKESGNDNPILQLSVSVLRETVGVARTDALYFRKHLQESVTP